MLSYRLALGVLLASQTPNQVDKTGRLGGHRKGSWVLLGVPREILDRDMINDELFLLGGLFDE